MKKRKKIQTIICLAVLSLLVMAPAKTVLAYFTSYVTAKGGHNVSLTWDTEVEEKVDGNQKTIRIVNHGEMPCFVRVKVLCGDMVELLYEKTDKWVDGEDGYWYYLDPVQPGGKTEDLIVSIIPDKDKLDADYDVIVIHESAPLSYDDNGKLKDPMSDDIWNRDFLYKGV